MTNTKVVEDLIIITSHYHWINKARTQQVNAGIEEMERWSQYTFTGLSIPQKWTQSTKQTQEYFLSAELGRTPENHLAWPKTKRNI